MNKNAMARVEKVPFVPSRLAALSLAALIFGGFTSANAFEIGHSRVVSEPGQPLVIQVPITNMTAEELASFSASLAPAASWQDSGLKPPVPLSSLSLEVKPGRRDNARLIELRSNQASQTPVVDVLLALSTSASSRTVQTSIIVPPPPKVRLASDLVTVQRGDTLSGIAKQFPVSGANLYQQLWALYSSNPDAFLRENMNLLKAGAALRIPDADAVRAVDPAFAKAQFLEHVRAFRQGRGGGQGNEGVAADGRAQTLQTPADQQQGSVEQAASEPVPPANDEVRLTAAQQDAQAAQADAEAARAKAIADESERKQALEQNITALQGAIDSAVQTDGPASTASTESPEANTEQTNADGSGALSGAEAQNADQPEQSAPGQAQTDGIASSTGFFSRVSQWVSVNTTAAIALLLALIALILAWALRATKHKTSAAQIHEKRVEHASAEFEQKLKDIDLSLDDKPEPSLSKPEDKA